MKNKSVRKVIVIISFILTIFILLYQYVLEKPQDLLLRSIEDISSEIKYTLIPRNLYYLKDNYKASSNIEIKTNTEKLFLPPDIINSSEEYANLLTNLNNNKISITKTQDKTNQKLLLEVDSTIEDKNLLSAKYLVENATKYYYIKGYTDNYINAGSANYFEIKNSLNSNTEKLEYVCDELISSLNKNLKNNKVTKTNESNLRKISLNLTKKDLENLLKEIIKDLKNDQDSNIILSSYNPNFKNLNVTKENFKNIKEITFNTYIGKYSYKIKKYELILKTTKNTYIIDFIYGKDNINKGTIKVNNDLFYYDYIKKDDKTKIIIKNDKQKKIGFIIIEQNNKNYNISCDLTNIKDLNIAGEYTTKISDLKKESFHVETTFELIISNKMSLDLKLKIDSKISKSTAIDEDIKMSIFKNSLTDLDKERLNNLIPDIKNKLFKK